MSEEKTQQLLYQMQMLEGYFSELIQKEEAIISLFREASSAVVSLKAIDNKTDSETLVPMGLGTFVKTKLIPNQKLILNVGAGVAIEKDQNYAINFLESRLKEMQVALQEIGGQKQQVSASLEQGKQQMNQLLAASRSKK
ncbi:MAG: prefoldin subunit alpha [Thaumarchaeota archaeon]|jgi:prefoldin alpha subunit|nr:MAG: prefoldin subunit alpha [Nitrososphaerota archaeon]HIA97206.1 prefoldin subunit alpha [Candidatus Nitrosopelagicus sp.]HIC05768.1 prefoldin subunit alpha [Candidatus Nitrosopelagicus sp.]HIC41858.1 prefoldin subunit alpha [Pelagibacterales bacterium]